MSYDFSCSISLHVGGEHEKYRVWSLAREADTWRGSAKPLKKIPVIDNGG